MLPHLDDAEIPVPSALFQFAWKNREALLEDSLAEYQEPDWWVERDDHEVVLKDDWGASVKIQTAPGGYYFEGETCGGHEYTVRLRRDKVTITLGDEESDYFIPLLLALNEHAEDFGMKKCKILIDQSKYRKLIYDDLFEHFAKSPRHHQDLVYSNPIDEVYKTIHWYSLETHNIVETVNVPGMGSLGGYLVYKAYIRCEFVVGL